MTGTQEEEELLRQIAVYAGAINRHQSRTSVNHGSARNTYQPYNRVGAASASGTRLSKNRTLVFSSPLLSDTAMPESKVSAWVSSRDRGHMTLTSAATYNSTTASKLLRIDETRALRRKEKLQRREAKEAERLKYLASKTMVHAGATYMLNKSATLLIRTSLHDVDSNPTPERTLISGIEFLKSPKTNNLFRKSTIKLRAGRTKSDLRPANFCKFFTRSGVCTNAKTCPYKHDADHLAICPRFLAPRGCISATCTLSHKPVSENTPTCLHFQRGACTKDDCRYMHVELAADALVCSTFARNGFCSKGAACCERHVHECPTFSNSGVCKLKHCRLPHVARANQRTAGLTASAPLQADQSESASDTDSDCSTDSYESEVFDENAFGDYVKL